ncbi:MAG: MmcQ/YjbR family DNA-binding protein [Saprospiraceae bacterium]|nr:MmcQ/YjbR family DNA-binding protein [Saprospiraceae bacterium]
MKLLEDTLVLLPEFTTGDHFEKKAFKVKNKIFMTLHADGSKITIKLSPADQDAFSLHPSKKIYPLPNKWGNQGWTIVEYTEVDAEMLHQLVVSAYVEVAPKTLSEQAKKLLD